MPVPRKNCETCRLRRVKCDYSDTPNGCTRCLKKGIVCPGVVHDSRSNSRDYRGKVVKHSELKAENVISSPSSSQPHHAASTTPSTPANFAYDAYLQNIDEDDEMSGDMVVTASRAEERLVSMELRSEAAVSILRSFLVSHGHLWQSIVSVISIEKVFDLRGNIEALSPVEEAMTRVLVALGARSTMHPLILPNADLTMPLTLGLVREGPCRQLANTAIERFDALGLWRQPTADVVLVGVSLFFIARTSYDAEYCRPIANMLVHLLRQYLSTTNPTINPKLPQFITSVGPLVLMADARCAAETGTRPLFTEDDLDDNPLLQNWLHQPLTGSMDGAGIVGGSRSGVAGVGERLDGLFAAMIRMLRSFAADFHRPIRQGSRKCLDALPNLWASHTALSTQVSIQMNQCAFDLVSSRSTSPCTTSHPQDATFSRTELPQATPKSESTKRFAHVLQLSGIVDFLGLMIHELLMQQCEVLGIEPGVVDGVTPNFAIGLDAGFGYEGASAEKTEWASCCLEAEMKAVGIMKHVAAHIKLVHSVTEGPEAWQHMSRLFHMLNTAPRWTAYLSAKRSGGVQLTTDECDIITSGVQEAGWGLGPASEKWLEIIQARSAWMSDLPGSEIGMVF